MKDSEFIELLNLYIDHEIGSEDARRLEAAVAASASRRRTYRQYCQIQKGCSLLSDERAPAPERRPAAVRAEPSGWGLWAYAGGAGLLAAACLAMVVVVRVRSGGPAVSAPMAALAPAPAKAGPAPLLADLHPVVSFRASAPAVETAHQPADQAVAWLYRDNLGSLNFTPEPASRLILAPTLVSTPANPLSPLESSNTPVEDVGFEFHR